jgi:NADPH-dependent 2,4-dienoyl-CoA reductase/sulfur reductase-like enzyme/nitrite reductase/ring-hydroxylating ferredoxin subunit
MPENGWTRVAREEDLAEGVPLSVKAGKKKLLLVRLEGKVHACGDRCTHYGGPLSEGLLRGKVVACPWHMAEFDVTTGRLVAAPALDDVPCYRVKVEGGDVYVAEGRKPKPLTSPGGDKRTFVIVGAGAAGNAAAETLRREGFGGRIALVTGEADGPYDRPSLSKDFMSGEASRKWLPLRKPEFYETAQIELLTGRRAAALDPAARRLTFANGEELRFDAALLATGGVPRPLKVPGADLRDVLLLRSLADAERIVAAAGKAGTAVVLGAGFIGMEVASALRQRGLRVHLVAPDAVPMAKVFGERVGNWLRGVHGENGVEFHLGETAAEVRGGGEVREVVLSGGTRLEADLIVAGLGITPATDWLQGSGLTEDGVVPVDGALRTKADGIYAAGDIAAVPDPHTGRLYRVEHWAVAERQGQHAARAMLGSDSPYGDVPFFWTMQFGNSVKFVGYPDRPDEVVVRGTVEEGDFLVGYYAGGRLRAVSAAGRALEAIAAGCLLKDGRSISPAEMKDEATDLRELALA